MSNDRIYLLNDTLCTKLIQIQRYYIQDLYQWDCVCNDMKSK